MSLHRRYFLLAVTLATVAATPAFGQVTPTVGAANSGKQGAAVPDFSGVWTHSIPGFEPLASGPTALVNRSRRQNGTGNNLQLVGDYTNPILKPRAAEVVKKHGEIALKGIGDPTPRNQCWPGGVPFVFSDRPTQMLQTPDKIVVLYGYNHQVRYVRLNQPHPAQVTPSWYGLCLRRRAFGAVTTDSRHGWRVVPNLARGMVPTRRCACGSTFVGLASTSIGYERRDRPRPQRRSGSCASAAGGRRSPGSSPLSR